MLAAAGAGGGSYYYNVWQSTGHTEIYNTGAALSSDGQAGVSFASAADTLGYNRDVVVTRFDADGNSIGQESFYLTNSYAQPYQAATTGFFSDTDHFISTVIFNPNNSTTNHGGVAILAMNSGGNLDTSYSKAAMKRGSNYNVNGSAAFQADDGSIYQAHNHTFSGTNYAEWGFDRFKDFTGYGSSEVNATNVNSNGRTHNGGVRYKNNGTFTGTCGAMDVDTTNSAVFMYHTKNGQISKHTFTNNSANPTPEWVTYWNAGDIYQAGTQGIIGSRYNSAYVWACSFQQGYNGNASNAREETQDMARLTRLNNSGGTKSQHWSFYENNFYNVGYDFKRTVFLAMKEDDSGNLYLVYADGEGGNSYGRHLSYTLVQQYQNTRVGVLKINSSGTVLSNNSVMGAFKNGQQQQLAVDLDIENNTVLFMGDTYTGTSTYRTKAVLKMPIDGSLNGTNYDIFGGNGKIYFEDSLSDYTLAVDSSVNFTTWTASAGDLNIQYLSPIYYNLPYATDNLYIGENPTTSHAVVNKVDLS